MKKIITIVTLLVNLITFSQNKPVYPEPKEGYKRVDLLLPKIENQKNLKVEVRFAFEKEMLECEEGSFNVDPNSITEKFGIGTSRYPYYVLENNNGDMFLGSNGNCNDVKKIKMMYSNKVIEYNYQSSYAVPFYIPKNLIVVYRVWSTTDNYIEVK